MAARWKVRQFGAVPDALRLGERTGRHVRWGVSAVRRWRGVLRPVLVHGLGTPHRMEMPGVYVDPARGTVACADHFSARIEEGELRIENATAYEARVRVLIDHDPDKPLGEFWWRGAPTIEVKSGGSASAPL